MTEQDAIDIIKAHINRQFPHTCPCCRKEYTSVKQYVLETRHVGAPISHDAELDDWQPSEPLGTNALAQCTCGTTLGVSSDGMRRLTLWRLMLWARSETSRQGIGMRQFLSNLRDKIDKSILEEDEC